MSDATRIDVAPNVTAWCRDVAIGQTAVWLVVSDGLRTYGHPEVALPLGVHPQLARDAAITTLAKVVGAIAGAAANGQRVAPGGTTRFGGQVFGFDGLFYSPAAPIGDHFLAASNLIGLFATADELTGVERFGARRLASLLAQQTHYYPYPPWTDAARPRIPLATWSSVLADMPRLGLPGATVTQIDNALHLRLGRATSAPVLHGALKQLPRETPPTFALHDVDRETADACLVWQPNQQEPAAVAPPGSRGARLGGCFIATANQQAQNGSQIVEDGFAYFLRDADYARLRAAWESAADITIRGDRPGNDLVVTWLDEAAPPQQTAPRRVRLVGVELLAEPPGIDAKVVAAYVHALAAVGEQVLPSLGAPYEVRLDVQAQIQVATRPISPPADVMQRFLEALRTVPAPQIRGLAFYAHLAVDA